MEEKIRARIAELAQLEKETQTKLIVIVNLLSELRALLTPDAPTLTGDPLTESPIVTSGDAAAA